MDFKRKVLLMSLLTGSIVSSTINPFSILHSDDINLHYNISSNALISEQYMVDSNIGIPIYDSMVPQGLTYVDDCFLTSSYDFCNLNESCVYTLDSSGNLLNTCSIGNRCHVGGISYDKLNDLIWITGPYGTVNAYKVNDILNKDSASPIYSDLDVGNGLRNYKNPFHNSISFLTTYNNKLYVGNFSLSSNGWIKEYDILIDSDSKYLTLKYVRKFLIPNKVQGVSFYSKNDNEYIIFNRSYGRDVNSVMQIFKYSPDILNYNDNKLNSVIVECPSMLEQSTMIDDEMYSTYESAALPYETDNSFPNFGVIDMDEIVKKLELY